MLFSGDKAVVYGILKGPSELMSPVDCTASIKGRTQDQPVEYSIPFEVPGNSPSFPIPIIHHLAAKALIKDWERDGGDKKSQIVKLSIESSVVSSHTAFVAIDENDKPIQGAMKMWDLTATVIQPQMVPLSSSSSASMVGCVRRSAGPRLPSSRAAMTSGGGGGPPPPPGGAYPSLSMACPPMAKGASGGSGVSWRKDSSQSPIQAKKKEKKSQRESLGSGSVGDADPLSGLISQQQADGSWRLDDVTAKLLSKSLQELKGGCPVTCEGGVSTLWATVLCVVYLEVKHASQKDEWELIAMKAEQWLGSRPLPAGADLSTLKAAAMKVVH